MVCRKEKRSIIKLTETENSPWGQPDTPPAQGNAVHIQAGGVKTYVYASGHSAQPSPAEGGSRERPGAAAAETMTGRAAQPERAAAHALPNPPRPAAHASERAPRQTPRASGAGGGRRADHRLALLAVVLSALSLLLSCVSLGMQLRPEKAAEPESAAEEAQPEEILTVQYRNHILEVLENVPANTYDASLFQRDAAGFLRYADAPVGIDVSSYQGVIDWPQVAAAGVDFAMIRLGLRGYTKGSIMTDATFEQNISGALAAGLDVGVYFFSQAVSVWEAEEEAGFVLEQLRGYELTYPVVFDWESINDPSARTNNVSSAELTLFAQAFCEKIAAAGYTPAIYFNQDQGYLGYQLDRLADYGFWLAEYGEAPGFFYEFGFWQYSERGSVPGIGGNVDLDLDLRAYAQGRAQSQAGAQNED